MQCPKCTGVALADTAAQQACAQCGGVFVSEALFGEMLATMATSSDEPRTLADYPIGTEPCAHCCPHCGEAMRSSWIERLPVERCALHGIWFDRTELERALARDVTPAKLNEGDTIRDRVVDVSVGVTAGTALALLAQYIGRVLLRHL